MKDGSSNTFTLLLSIAGCASTRNSSLRSIQGTFVIDVKARAPLFRNAYFIDLDPEIIAWQKSYFSKSLLLCTAYGLV